MSSGDAAGTQSDEPSDRIGELGLRQRQAARRQLVRIMEVGGQEQIERRRLSSCA